MAIFNTFLFDTLEFNGSLMNNTVYSTDLVVFDSFSLSDNVNTFVRDIIDSGPTRDLIDGPIPRSSGMYLIADYFRQRTVTVTGIVKAADAASLDAYLDTMRKNLWGRAANLDLTRNGVVRRYIATMTAFDTFIA